MITVTLNQPDACYLPGDKLEGTVRWQLDSPHSSPRSLLIQLLYFTRGKGTQDVALGPSVRIDSPGLSGERGFFINLPDRPYSFSGKLISLTWAVEVSVEPKGETQRVEFVLSPMGQEIILPAEPSNS